VDFSPQQCAALDAVSEWLSAGDRAWFYLAGYAGTGKTTIARHLAEGRNALFAAFTGKAAHVMRRAGCLEASTILSLIYHVTEHGRGRLEDLIARAQAAGERQEPDAELLARLDAEIREERKLVGKPRFELNEDSRLREAELLVIDECSMVDERVANDLLSFEVPILVLGDPAQLPPVYGAGFFTKRAPDAFLTEIHRQARDNPIIRMATTIREGGRLEPGEYGASRVLPSRAFDPASIGPGAQILVGKNDTRRRANVTRRRRLGFGGELPEAGERLVCLRNDHELGLLNGAIWGVVHRGADCGDVIELTIEEPDDGGRLTVPVHRAPFEGREVEPFLRREAAEFDYGYALTVHKSQGSQWPEVVVVDEARVFRQDAHRWLYTSVTRAIERVTVIT
jgi:exodeoxyribonuclease-5